MAKLLIDIDVKGEVKVTNLDKSLKNLEHDSRKVDTQNKKTSSSFLKMATATAAVVGSIYLLQKALKAVISSGFEYNKQMEDAQAGLSALSLAIQDKNIPLTERMATATLEAAAAMKALEAINAKTPHTLNQTNKIYKAMFVSMKNVGASSQEIIDLTQKLSVAAGAAGIEFNSLLAGVDGLATGTVLANSDLGRFLGSLGLTNDVLKESNDVVKLLNETLQDFKALDTYATATSNLQNAWDKLAGSMLEDIFVGAKDGLNDMSNTINSLTTAELDSLRTTFNNVAITIASATMTIIDVVGDVYVKFKELSAVLFEVGERATNWGRLSTEAAAQSRANFVEIENFKLSQDRLNQTLQDGIDKFKLGIIASEKKREADRLLGDETDILNVKIEKTVGLLGQATDAEIEKIYADELLLLGLDAQGDELEAVNDQLKDAYGLYSVASGAADDYATSIDNITDALEGNQAAASYTTVTRLETPQDYADYGFALPADYYTNPEYQTGFADGGYTGNVGTTDVAGVVHGQEYVVDAKTTKDLGLNGEGGVFKEMNAKLGELAHLYEINKTLKKMLVINRATQTLLQERVVV